MSNPQLERGYTRIATEILSELARYRLTGQEWQVLLVIWLKTYTWHKKEESISISTFSKMTLMQKRCVIRSLRSLCAKGVTKMSRGKVTTYSFVKDYEKWKHVTKLSHDKNVTKHVTKLSPPSDKNVTTYNSKDTLLKDIKDSNADFISMLKTSPAYRHVDVEQELAKMDVWLNVNKGRKKTKRFVVNWLNKVEKPLESTKPKSVAL